MGPEAREGPGLLVSPPLHAEGAQVASAQVLRRLSWLWVTLLPGGREESPPVASGRLE